MNFKADQSKEKLRGGYYTPPHIAAFLLRWALERNPSSLLEPGCGDGAFLRQLPAMAPRSLREVLAFEIEADEAEKSRQASAGLAGAKVEVVNGDFLSWVMRSTLRPRCTDAVVGNPPFIRYQYIDREAQIVAESLFRHLGLPFTKHTNLWVSFVAASLSLLNPGGRLAMVVPAEILHVLHAQGLRSYLNAACARVLIVDPTDLWFADALQGAVLLMAEKKLSPRDAGEGVAVRRVRNSDFFRADPRDLFRGVRFSNGEEMSGKWMRALLSPKQRGILEDAGSRRGVHRFKDVASVDVGIVTGANKFFLVTDQVVDDFGLHEWAHPMFGRSNQVPGVVYSEKVRDENRRDGMPTNFLWFGDTSRSRLPSSVLRYIKQGEDEALHERFKCRTRSPWYNVPSVYSTPIGMLKRSNDFPRLVLNELEAFTTDTAYRITAEGRSPKSLVFSFVNSLTAVSAELEGRHYGGGVLELVPSEIERLLLPLVSASPHDVRMLDQRVRQRTSAADLLLQQDELVLRRIGFSAIEIVQIHEMWENLRGRRQRHEPADDGATADAA